MASTTPLARVTGEGPGVRRCHPTLRTHRIPRHSHPSCYRGVAALGSSAHCMPHAERTANPRFEHTVSWVRTHEKIAGKRSPRERLRRSGVTAALEPARCDGRGGRSVRPEMTGLL